MSSAICPSLLLAGALEALADAARSECRQQLDSDPIGTVCGCDSSWQEIVCGRKSERSDLALLLLAEDAWFHQPAADGGLQGCASWIRPSNNRRSSTEPNFAEQAT